MGTQLPSPKGGRAAPIFRPFYCGQMAGFIKMPLCMEVGLISDVVPAPLPKNGAEPPPQFSAHVYCGQTAGWIKMALGMEVGLGPRYIVLDGDPAPLPKRGQSPPHFRPFLLWPNGWMHQDATLYGCRPQPRRLCVRWGPSPLSPKRGGAPFRPSSIVAKRLHGSRCRLVWR